VGGATRRHHRVAPAAGNRVLVVADESFG